MEDRRLLLPALGREGSLGELVSESWKQAPGSAPRKAKGRIQGQGAGERTGPQLLDAAL